MKRPPRILHCTSEPKTFVGRTGELSLVTEAFRGGNLSLVALVGPGGQGKTAITHHWLHSEPNDADGVFFWSFYRGKDGDRCLREWVAYAENLSTLPDASSSWCADRLLFHLRRERWAVVLDGAEVVQHEGGPWHGRLLHPDLGRLLEEIASGPMPGVILLTSRFSLPFLEKRAHFQLVELEHLDPISAQSLLIKIGVRGTEDALSRVAAAAGHHAKAVELLGTLLVWFFQSEAAQLPIKVAEIGQDVEYQVSSVLDCFRLHLPQDLQDIVSLASSFREPPSQDLLIRYLQSSSVEQLLRTNRGRTYPPFSCRTTDSIQEAIGQVVGMRLLERVGPGTEQVIDAHPLVRRGFEPGIMGGDFRATASSRAGFLRGRPDRVRPETMQDASESLELFFAYCDAQLWAEADSIFRSLENPKHRWLAPSLEKDLLSRFFPSGNWNAPPLWPGFARWRSLAISLEMLGYFEEALNLYRPTDEALSGDALIALGKLGPLLEQPRKPAPWNDLWQAYRSHALTLAGHRNKALELVQTLSPLDTYEWVHVFECLLRLGRLDLMDLKSLDQNRKHDHPWNQLARRRISADYLRCQGDPSFELIGEYQDIQQKYDQAGLPVERLIVRLSLSSLFITLKRFDEAEECLRQADEIEGRYRLVSWGPDIANGLIQCLVGQGNPEEAEIFQPKANTLWQKWGGQPCPRP